MTGQEITGLIIGILIIIGLLVALYIYTLKVAEKEAKEKQARSEMYKEITNYLRKKDKK